jgi:hypothetical protein
VIEVKVNKILDGPDESLAFARGETAGGLTTFVGGPYFKDEERPLIQHKVSNHWIIWNWETGRWDKCATQVRVIKQTISKNLVETLDWITENAHHRGYWTGGEKFFVLEGQDATLFIPVAVHVPGMMEGDDWKTTKRMYRPSEAGRAFLDAHARQMVEAPAESPARGA